jgi:hypothetical protein
MEQWNVYRGSTWVTRIKAIDSRSALKKARKALGPGGGKLKVVRFDFHYDSSIKKNPKQPHKRVRKALKKYVKHQLSKKNPRREYQVHVPATKGDRGYEIKVKAPSVSSALAAARKYCAGRAGKSVREFKLPRGTKARVI